MKPERPLYYVLEGRTPRPVDRDYWLALRVFEEDAEARRVAFDTLAGSEVSTVFLWIDHAFGTGPPVLFETMVFGGPLDGECDRYCTYEEAEAGHAAMLARVREARAP